MTGRARDVWYRGRTLGLLIAFLWVWVCPGSARAQLWDFDFWASVSPAAGWSIDAGDFDADGRGDLVVYHPVDGSVAVGTNQGGSFSFASWGNVSPVAGWSIAAGEFTGDQRADVVLYHPSDGTVTVGTNLGSSFGFVSWGHVDPAAGWSINAGDFNGDGLSDVVLYHPDDGRILVGINLGSSFDFGTWATLSPASGWSLDAGRFNADARSDVLAYHPSDGSVWVLESSGSDFEFDAPWALVTPASDWSFDPADVCLTSGLTLCLFEGDGLDDVLGYHPADGTVWAGRNTGTGSFAFGAAAVATVSPQPGWLFAGGRFWGTQIGGAAFYYPGDGSIYMTTSRPPAQGYAWPLSAGPGEIVDFMVSGMAQPTVKFYRHTSVPDGPPGPAADAPVTSTLMGSRTFIAEEQATLTDSFRNGAGWAPSFNLIIPSNWPPGIYSAGLTRPEGEIEHVVFIVRADPAQRSRLALLANTNTWNAYNTFGGQGRYSQPVPDPPVFSFLRPSSARTSPLVESASGKHLTRAELWVLGFLDAEGHAPDVYADSDMHDGGFLADYDFLVVGTHPEYWTVEMYDNLQAFLAQGGSLLYLGGNGIFESVRFVNGGSALEFQQGDADAPRADSFFRNLQPPRAERSLLGVSTEDCSFSPGDAYRVLEPEHPLFSATGLSADDLIGDFGLNTGGDPGNYDGTASGHETDTSAGPGATAATVCGLTAPTNPLSPAPLPQGLQVIARAGTPAEPGSDMTFYRHPGGGFVLSVGSINFGGSLAVEPKLQQVIRNALTDSDVDGAIDVLDNCPATANADQDDRDVDSIGDLCDPCPDHPSGGTDVDENGIGDECECGDQNEDGTVNVGDLLAINAVLFGQQPPSPLCDTNEDGLCNVADILGANAKIFGQPAYCSRWPAP